MRKPMSTRHRLVLKRNYVMLSNEMQVEYMLPYFIQESVLTPDMVEEIKKNSTSFSMNDKLLQMLPYRGDKAYNTLIDSLKYGTGQLHLVHILENTCIPDQEMDESEYERAQHDSPNPYETESDEENVLTQSNSSNRNSWSARRAKISGEQSARKIRKPRTRNVIKNHKEQLQEVSHLFPYIAPHIHKKWKPLAKELGLTEEDMTSVIEIPHAKQSKYSMVILEMWARKEKGKTTKLKLTEALERLKLKKALDAISIYEIPKVKTRMPRKTSTSSLGSVENGKMSVPKFKSRYLSPSRRDQRESNKVIATPRRTGYGHLPIKCEIAQIDPINDMSASEQSGVTQSTFLSLADRIATSMVERGDDVTHILNTMERLQGIVFKGVHKGSIVLEAQALYLLALERLMGLYSSRELVPLLEEALVTPDLLHKYRASQVRLTVTIASDDYAVCRKELLKLKSPASAEVEAESSTDIFTSDEYQPSGDDSSDEEACDEITALFHETLDVLRSLRASLSDNVVKFNTTCSEFLMTLQLIHPLHIRQVETISQVEEFRSSIQNSSMCNLSVASVEFYLNLHHQTSQQIQGAWERLTHAISELDYKGNATNRSLVRKLEASANDLLTIRRMLTKSYNFSLLTHTSSMQLTTLETAGYRGLVSLFLVILDRLLLAENSLL